jgi:hypothetical protein
MKLMPADLVYAQHSREADPALLAECGGLRCYVPEGRPPEERPGPSPPVTGTDLAVTSGNPTGSLSHQRIDAVSLVAFVAFTRTCASDQSRTARHNKKTVKGEVLRSPSRRVHCRRECRIRRAPPNDRFLVREKTRDSRDVYAPVQTAMPVYRSPREMARCSGIRATPRMEPRSGST